MRSLPNAVSFWVAGTPKPQGSKNAIPIYRGRGETKRFTGRVALKESASDALKTWRDDVRARGMLAMVDQDMFTDPVRVVIRFYLARPKGHLGQGRNAGTVRESAPRWPAVRPDLDKLLRATLDALKSAGVYTDDSIVIRVTGTKLYADPGMPTGAQISVMSMAEDPWKDRTVQLELSEAAEIAGRR